MFERKRAKDPDVLKKAIAHTKKVAAAYAGFFEDYDVLLTPVLRRPPLLIGEQGSFKSFDALYENVLDYVPYTPQYNVAGNPAISLPLYTSSKGLPIGSQFATRFGAAHLSAPAVQIADHIAHMLVRCHHLDQHNRLQQFCTGIA